MHTNMLIQTALDQYHIGNFEQAESIAREILSAQPGNAEALHLLGLISYKNGNLDAALKDLRKSVKANPNNADAFYDLGNVLQEKGEAVRAITNYKKALKLNPAYIEAYNNMGIALQDTGKVEKAIQCYQNALRIEPAYADAHNNLGVAFLEKEQRADAITHFQKALQARPEYADAYHNLVDAVQGKGGADKDKPQRIYAVYRCLSGEDFIQESVASISGHVDKIFVFWDDAPQGDIKECMYRGGKVSFPKQFDTMVEKIKALNDPRIVLIHDHQDVPEGHLTHCVNDLILPAYEKPSILLSLEPEHVFRTDQLQKAIEEFIESDYVFATTHEIQIWKGLRHRLPERPNKVGAVFCNLRILDKMPATLKHGGILVMPKLSAYVHNFSFAVSDKAMYWRHLLAISVAQRFGETPPDENWYDETWLKWDYETHNGNLGMSVQYPIGSAVPYEVNELPEQVKRKLQ